MRDLKSKEVTHCLLCGESIESSHVHDSCLENAVTYKAETDRDAERFLYGLYKFGELVYIGIAKDPRSRFKQHLLTKDVDRMHVVRGGPSRLIELAERKQIHKRIPVLNNQLHTEDGGFYRATETTTRVVSYIDVAQTITAVSLDDLESAKEIVGKVKTRMQAEIDACRERIEFLEAQLINVVPDTPALLEESW
ncbi:hypothetical protein ACIRD8_02300 [Streptomyces sp. NPDC102451]|uniref:hypothetical protein n=1 Tax=Streptomyces sp. NPDC102451 TaxID=3366177 RepID=UPI003803E384